ncbi:hypothetical protein [Streptomyces sp. WM6378]|uniref:hypothetical protein n=1 Tax=Streptomyces sp. WM6378 TaxID=1415557 RepID=UPI0006B03C1F|nr:hypothetical protein [Streptomyces sp. WM6378]KOU52315.1 hypothetical protein ADK54_07785 [Streptomyces sp. WM6378]
MTTQWNPYAYPGQAAPGWLPLKTDGPDARWWVAPSVCTLALVLSAWIDLSALSGFGARPGWATVAVYAVPGALIATSWLLPHRRTLRPARIGLGAGGVALAFVLTKIFAMAIMIVFLCVALMFGWNLHD